jgi:hypothetical protein
MTVPPAAMDGGGLLDRFEHPTKQANSKLATTMAGKRVKAWMTP